MFIAITIVAGLNEVAFAIDMNDNVTTKDENITLDGMIGPYDPNDPENDPDFSELTSDDIEGTLPDNYYTIAVTVPTQLEFTVFSGFGRGQFYSPKYTIENKATRPIYVSVKNLEENFDGDDTFNKLYLRYPTSYDDNTEIDLYLRMTNLISNINRKVHLTENYTAINTTSETRYLGKLGLKESGTLQFESSWWDVPGLDAPDKHAKNDFTIQLEFSLEDPLATPTPDGDSSTN